jgi:hypothetical protein
MTKEIALSQQGKYKGQFVALVDDADYEELSKYRWSVAAMYKARNHGLLYAVRTEDKRTIYMHHEIIGMPSKGKVIDHIDWNGLNNTRGNLREATVSQNKLNRYR